MQGFGKLAGLNLDDMLALILLGEAIVEPGTVAPPAKARATVRIVHAATATRDQWKDAPPGRKREVIRKAVDGRVELLRIIDYP